MLKWDLLMPCIHTASPLTDVPGLLEQNIPQVKRQLVGQRRFLFKSNGSLCLSEGVSPNCFWCLSLKQRSSQCSARLEPVQMSHCTGATQATTAANWAELNRCRYVRVFSNASWKLDSQRAATPALTVGSHGSAVIGRSAGILQEKPRGFFALNCLL